MASLRNLDLNLLKVFHAIYASRSVSGAARRMGVSQPSVSRGLGRLREHFDDPLFERSGNGVAPTAKAETILDSVKSALELIEGTIEEDIVFDPATAKRHFRMVMPDPVELMVMPGIIKRLPAGSQITFEALTFTDIDLRATLTEGDVDVAMVPFLPDETDLSYRHLFGTSFVIIARKGHPDLVDGFSWSLLERLRFAALPDFIFRMSRLDEMLRTQGLQRHVAYTAHRMSSIPPLVASTDLVAFAGNQYAQLLRERWDIDIFEAPGLSAVKQEFYVGYAKAADNDLGLQWLCDQIEAAYRDQAVALDLARA